MFESRFVRGGENGEIALAVKILSTSEPILRLFVLRSPDFA